MYYYIIKSYWITLKTSYFYYNFNKNKLYKTANVFQVVSLMPPIVFYCSSVLLPH